VATTGSAHERAYQRMHAMWASRRRARSDSGTFFSGHTLLTGPVTAAVLGVSGVFFSLHYVFLVRIYI
jgi:hypothetical protein